MRAIPILVFLLGGLAAAAWWSTESASRTDGIVRAREEAHQRFAAIPEEEFLRDRANVFAGRVVDPQGAAVAGAEVRLLDLAAMQAAAAAAPAGEWPGFPVEQRAVTDTDGRYRMEGLVYGNKHAIVSCVGFHPAIVPRVSFADGYGADGMDVALASAVERIVSLKHVDDAPAADLDVRILPLHWGAAAIPSRTDASGVLAIPAERCAPDQDLLLLVGEPPLPLRLTPDRSELTLPARSALVVRVAGVEEGSLDVTLLPEAGRHPGYVSREVSPEEGRIEILAVWHGAWQLLVRQGDRLGDLRLQHEGSEVELSLAPVRGLEVQVATAGGAAHGAELAWQAVPFRSPDPLRDEPTTWLAAADPTRVIASTDEEGRAVVPSAGGRRGWLMAVAPNHPPAVVEVTAEQSAVALQLSQAVEVSIRTNRPYLGLQLQCDGLPELVGLSDAASECFFLVPPGPIVARANFGSKGHSYPKGYWAGISTGVLRFSLLDDRGQPRGCVYGFVRDHQGLPVAGAEVFVQGADGRPDRGETDEHGFYRFTGLPAGGYIAFARPPGEYTAWWKLEGAQVPSADGGSEGEARADLRIWPCALELRAAADVWELEIQDQDGERITGGAPDDEGRLMVTCLPPGSYRIVARDSEDDAGRPVGEVELTIERTEPSVVEVGR